LAAISAGIAEALITTALGLFVAIPAVWLYNYFTAKIEFIGMEIDYGGKEFMNFLLVLEARMAGGSSPARSSVKVGHS
jgi:biopolymer transport protein ExbB/biopolymer transport protein TolQ